MTKSSLGIALLSVAGLLVAGCSSGNGGISTITCEANPGIAGHLCENVIYMGLTASPTCPGGNEVTTCPSDGALGTCAYSISMGDVTESISAVYYSDGDVTAETAQSACLSLSSATWTAK